MRSIRISEEVWQAIASRGKFGETEDDVLRRVFELPPNSMHAGVQSTTGIGEHRSPRVPSAPRRSFATQRMTSFISQDQLHIEFQGGASFSCKLPDRSNKAGIRTMLDKAIVFARDNGASIGQINAVRKTLTTEGYHLTK